MAARYAAIAGLTAVAAISGGGGVGVAAQITSVTIGAPPPPLAYASFGMLEVGFNYTDAGTPGALLGFNVTAVPMDEREEFDAQLPMDGSSPWYWDAGLPANATAPAPSLPAPISSQVTVAGGALQMSIGGVATAAGATRGNATYLYRKLPEGGLLETGVNCTAVFAAHRNARCGVVVYDAGTGMHLALCGITRRNGGAPFTVELEGANGTALVSSSVESVGVPWSSGVTYFRIERDATNRLFRCRARSSLATGDAGWAAAASITLLDTALRVSFDVGDLWYGLAAAAWGSTPTVFANASFVYVRSLVPVPAAAPTDVNSEVDRCLVGTRVTPRWAFLAPTARSTRFTGLSQNFPYTVSVVEVRSGGNEAPYRAYLPHAYARPMPPRQWALGAWYDARHIFASSALAPGTNRLGRWPDASGRGHHLLSSGNLRPVIIASQVSPAVWLSDGARSRHHVRRSPALIAGRHARHPVPTRKGHVDELWRRLHRPGHQHRVLRLHAFAGDQLGTLHSSRTRHQQGDVAARMGAYAVRGHVEPVAGNARHPRHRERRPAGCAWSRQPRALVLHPSGRAHARFHQHSTAAVER